MAKRPPIPVELERAVLVEAGHRCAIPTCRQSPIEIAHIVGWAKCKKHEFHNLIPLCPTCHTRFDRGEIDHKSMVFYKHNLAILNGRYGSTKLRVLKFFSKDPAPSEIRLLSEMQLLVQNLLDDQLLADMGNDQQIAGGELIRKSYTLTQSGKEYVERWMAPVEE